jgi:hypothetical protein
MVPKRQFDDDAALVSKIEQLMITKPNVPAVCFKSCNYDTFIAKMGDIFLVETCHNHDWDLYDFTTQCPAEYYEYYGDDSFYNLEHSIDWLHLEYDVIGRPADWKDTKDFDYQCKNGHWDSHWWIGETIKCPACGELPQPRKKS